jgi:23S rRNA-intervening sequence protein
LDAARVNPVLLVVLDLLVCAHDGEFRRFLDIAIGSLSEISYASLLAADLGILKPESAKEIAERRERTSKITWGLYKSVSRNATKRGVSAA